MNSRQRIVLVITVVALVASLILIPSFFMGDNYTKITNPESIDYVKISVLVDNNPNGTLECPWGLSILVETKNLAILFDAGPSGSALKNNSESLGIDLEATCDFIVISHEHLDHVDGLAYISDIHDDLTFYTPIVGTGFSWILSQRPWWSDFNAIKVGDTVELSSGIAVIPMNYEQALVLYVKNLGLVVLTGCSHPGVENLVARAIDVFGVDDVYMVMGGFHLHNVNSDKRSDAIEALIDIGVQYIYPLHCSGDETRTYLESNHPANYGEASVGFQIVLNGTA